MSSVLRPIIINNPRESIYIANNRTREEIERKIEEYETIINPISENYEESNNRLNVVNNSVINNESRNNDYSQYQDVINPLIINRRNRNSENNSGENSALETESSIETSYELFESTEEDETSETDDNEEQIVVNTSSSKDSLVECEKEFNEVLKKFLEESLGSNESDTDSQSCAICLNKISNTMSDGDVHIEYDECGHKVHIDCMKKWRRHRELSTNFKKMRFLKCELCQIPRSFTIVKSLVEVKKSNRMRKMCCIV